MDKCRTRDRRAVRHTSLVTEQTVPTSTTTAYAPLRYGVHLLVAVAIGIVSPFTALAWPFALLVGIAIGSADARRSRGEAAAPGQGFFTGLSVILGTVGMLFFGAIIGGLIADRGRRARGVLGTSCRARLADRSGRREAPPVRRPRRHVVRRVPAARVQRRRSNRRLGLPAIDGGHEGATQDGRQVAWNAVAVGRERCAEALQSRASSTSTSRSRARTAANHPASSHAEPVASARPRTPTDQPTYIGLRVNAYAPLVTSAESLSTSASPAEATAHAARPMPVASIGAARARRVRRDRAGCAAAARSGGRRLPRWPPHGARERGRSTSAWSATSDRRPR